MPYLCLWRRNFCVAGGVLFSYSGAIFELSRSPFIDYSGAKYVRSALKIALTWKSLFRVVENGKFLKRLLNGHLEKSAVTGVCPPHVHPRLRKRPPRCTLDCGFKTPESPALRGFVGGLRALATAALYLVLKSNGLPRPKIRLKKFGFSSKSVPANIAKKLPSQRCFKPLLIPIFNFPYKRPTLIFAGESGYTLGFAQRIAHKGTHGETRGVSDGGVVSLPSERSARFGNPAWPGGRTANFAAFGSWPGVLSKNAESLRNSDALMRVAVPQASRPRWAA